MERCVAGTKGNIYYVSLEFSEEENETGEEIRKRLKDKFIRENIIAAKEMEIGALCESNGGECSEES